jgi:hypothetical protein
MSDFTKLTIEEADGAWRVIDENGAILNSYKTRAAAESRIKTLSSYEAGGFIHGGIVARESNNIKKYNLSARAAKGEGLQNIIDENIITP